MMRKHLAIFSQNAVDAMFAGTKRIETRFSQKRIAPFGQVEVGDLVYIKPSGKDIVGQFRVKKVISFEGLDTEDFDMIKSEYGPLVSLGSDKADKDYFESHKSAKYGTLIFIGSLEQFLTSPVRIQKSDLRGWVVLSK